MVECILEEGLEKTAYLNVCSQLLHFGGGLGVALHVTSLPSDRIGWQRLKAPDYTDLLNTTLGSFHHLYGTTLCVCLSG